MTLFSMDGPEGIVESTVEIIEVASTYYKELFKFESKPDINIDKQFFS
jgi:hypothetical protein